jgi:hypothetical protein
MAKLDEIVDELESLSPESLEELGHFVRYLRWRQVPQQAAATGKPWTFDFVEAFRQASVLADHSPAGMEVQVGEAACGGEALVALWQHPPVKGAAIVEYQVPIPAGMRKLCLRFATGIRDGSQLAPGNIVAFRIFVDDWKMWSDTQSARKWNQREVEMPSVSGDVLRIQFVTDGLGNHQWAWAAWGKPRLEGELPA